MKSIKALCVIGILSLIFSCSYQEDTAAFFINNQLNKNLTVDGMSENVNSSIYSYTDLDLMSIESYGRYIQRLTSIDIIKIDCEFANYEGSISNGKLYLDEILLGGFNNSNVRISFSDPEILMSIAERFLEKTSLEVSFVGESDVAYYLSVDIEIEMQATFVH
ncbi:MAG: hypothetical protein JKY02_09440 [Flavobacteriaceae bacterium]|nr:hypothetical protein [Flavobacteriaceae bacterium]